MATKLLRTILINIYKLYLHYLQDVLVSENAGGNATPVQPLLYYSQVLFHINFLFYQKFIFHFFVCVGT